MHLLKKPSILIKLFGFLFVFFPLVVSADIRISEIMYDLAEGGDTGREWIEVYNNSSESINLSEWKLFEANVNHSLNIFQGSEVLLASGIAIIADNPSKFLIDNPSYSGVIFDSSFSLNNTGETLTIRDPELVDVHTVSYSSDLGGAGDGNSLHVFSGTLSASAPTPGLFGGNTDTSPNLAEDSNDSSDSGDMSQETNSSSSTKSYPVEPQIKIIPPKNKTVLVGADTSFEAKVYGIKGGLIEDARVIWNFGDGGRSEGGNVLHNFRYPGKYVVFIDGASGEYSSTARLEVMAIKPEVFIKEIDSSLGAFILIRNDSSKDIDLSFWRLRTGDKYFSIPKNTYVLSKNEVAFASVYTSLDSRTQPIELMYPNGEVLHRYGEKAKEDIIVSKTNTAPPILKAPSPISEVKKEVNLASPAVAEVFETNDIQTEEDLFETEEDSEASNLWLFVFIILVALATFLVWFVRKNIANEDEDEEETSYEEEIEEIAEEVEIIE